MIHWVKIIFNKHPVWKSLSKQELFALYLLQKNENVLFANTNSGTWSVQLLVVSYPQLSLT